MLHNLYDYLAYSTLYPPDMILKIKGPEAWEAASSFEAFHPPLPLLLILFWVVAKQWVVQEHICKLLRILQPIATGWKWLIIPC